MAVKTGLMVPIDVAAFCVGATDDTHEFAGATTNYVNQATTDLPAFLGINVTRGCGPYDAPLWPLEAGVHLHWAMPDGLTKANPSSRPLTFPPLPNRWLVTRIVVQGASTTKAQWIIESDTLSTAPSVKTIPTLPVQDAQNFRYVGVWQVFDGSWTEPAIPPNQTIAALFGSQMHAVASGDIAFAAFYPNTRGIFGFYDNLSDLTVTDSNPVNLMYLVTGWFSDSKNDPLATNPALNVLQETYSWTYASSPPVSLTYSLYHGIVQNIEWNPRKNYITNSAPIELDVAVGNSPAEALAAYFRGLNKPSIPIFEQLFTMFEAGLLATFKQPQPGQLAEMAEVLHEMMFARHDAGTIYTVTHKAPTEDVKGLDAQDIAPDLPLPLADALNLLNRYLQEADLALIEVTQYRWQLFADWYRLFEVNPNDLNEAFNTFSQRVNRWTAIQQNLTTSQTRVQSQLAIVKPMIGNSLELKQSPAPRYWEPNEPVVLIAGKQIVAPRRYGGDGGYHPDGFLSCRLTTDVLTAVTINTGTTTSLSSNQFSSVLPPSPNNLIYGADIGALLEESCLLNTALVAALTGSTDATLAAGLTAWLEHSQASGNPYQQFTGVLPSPVGVQRWAGSNPWFPLMLLWQANFHPLMPTVQGPQLQDYAAQFFTGNYAVDPNNEGMIAYTPGGVGSITVDPKTINFDPTVAGSGTQSYSGVSVLSPKATDNLQTQLRNYFAAPNTDSTLQAILSQLQGTNILMQALSGFNDALLMREQSLQLKMAVSTHVLDFRQATAQAVNIIGPMSNIPARAPLFQGSFNPLRAGYMQLDLQVLDAYGQRHPVAVTNLYIAESLAAYYRQQLEPGIIYLQPRLTAPARLLFQWLSADTEEYEEMNTHPATSPICGWLLPDHLQQGFFFYNATGKPLGSLNVKPDLAGLVWQATPGDDRTINEDLPTVMQSENPHLRDFSVALSRTTPAVFVAFWQAVDTANHLSAPLDPNSNTGMATLVGRPVALAQASLRLELQGITPYNLSWNTLDKGNVFVETDNALGQVQFPVVLGDLQQIDDGLVGYYKQNTSGEYDFSTFYTEAAPSGGTLVVVRPTPTNILVTPNSTVEGQPPDVTSGKQKVLMLLDPRAGIHATMGLLPTQFVEIPPHQYADTLSNLEMTFLTAPVLQPSSGMTLPLTTEGGYNWSWIEEVQVTGGLSEWLVKANITPPTGNAVWRYTPQTICEGWLRLNPEVLSFALLNSAKAPVVISGSIAALTLTITNLRQTAITFKPGVLVNEGTPTEGSIFYIHFGALVPAARVSTIQLAAKDWTFKALTDSRYGSYWAASPEAGTHATLAPGSSLNISLAQIQIASPGAQAQVYFDYYNVQGDSDGIAIAILSIQKA